MKLILLGTGTAVPRLDRSSSAYLLKAGGKNILVDCGAGTLRRLLEADVTYNDIDLILLTHLHPDHTADLVPFFFACRYASRPRTRPLDLVGGNGTKDFLHCLNETFGGHLRSPGYPLHIREVGDESWDWEGLAFTATSVLHIPNSRALAVQAGSKKVVFSGDTGFCTALITAARGADVFVCECALPDREQPDNHLSPSLVGKIAAQADVSRLVLTHFYPEVESEPIVDIVGKSFSGEIILGRDLMQIDV